MRIVILASGAFAEPTIRRLAEGEHEIGLVVTQPARGSGRGRSPTPTPVKILADELGLPVAECENVNAPELTGRIRKLSPRVMLVIAFGQKLGAEFLSAAPGGAVNLHASLLPKFRGAAPIHWALARGETRTGCTVFQIVQKMDAGPIYVQDALDIEADENAGQLHDRLARLGVQTVEATLSMFLQDGNPVGIVQDESLATLAPKLKKSDGFVRFDSPTRHIINLIRGMTPWPSATAQYTAADGRKEIVTIIQARTAGEELRPPMSPGTITEKLSVVAQDGTIEIREIQPASGRAMSWSAFVNGRHVRPGDRFDSLG